MTPHIAHPAQGRRTLAAVGLTVLTCLGAGLSNVPTREPAHPATLSVQKPAEPLTFEQLVGVRGVTVEAGIPEDVALEAYRFVQSGWCFERLHRMRALGLSDDAVIWKLIMDPEPVTPALPRFTDRVAAIRRAADADSALLVEARRGSEDGRYRGVTHRIEKAGDRWILVSSVPWFIAAPTMPTFAPMDVGVVEEPSGR